LPATLSRPTLYYSPGACSLAPHVLLEEIGLPHSLALVSVADDATQSPAFRAINPKGRVPVLAEGDWILTEVPAILAWLAQQAPERGLWPEEAAALARTLEWFNWLSGTLHAVAFGALWRPRRFLAEEAGFEALGRQARTNVDAGFAHVEARLRGRTWAVGDRYGCVDPYLLVFYRWGNRISVDMRGTYPAWTAQAEAVCARPAVQAALAREGIVVW
jgi:glutathione S-transferase